MDLTKLLPLFDVSKHIANHVAGPKHTHRHHKIAGIVVMAFGVGVAKSAMMSDMFLVHFVADIIGYGIHAKQLAASVR